MITIHKFNCWRGRHVQSAKYKTLCEHCDAWVLNCDNCGKLKARSDLRYKGAALRGGKAVDRYICDKPCRTESKHKKGVKV